MKTTPSTHVPAGGQAFPLAHRAGRPWAPQAVLFDCDGTLVDTEPSWTAALVALFAGYGRPWLASHKAHFIGLTTGAMAERAAALVAPGAGRCDIDLLEKQLVELVIEAVSVSATPMPGALAMVEAVSRTTPVAVVSNSPRPLLDIALARGGFEPQGFITIAAGEAALPKPAPDPYLEASRRLGVAADQALAVEDSRTGLASARAAGLATLGVPTLPENSFPADAVVPSLEAPQLMAWVASWGRPPLPAR